MGRNDAGESGRDREDSRAWTSNDACSAWTWEKPCDRGSGDNHINDDSSGCNFGILTSNRVYEHTKRNKILQDHMNMDLVESLVRSWFCKE